MKKAILLVGAVCWFYSPFLFASEKTDLRKQIDSLQERVDALEVQKNQGGGSVNTFLARHISLGGFFENAITGIFSKDADYQLSASSHIFGVNLGVTLNDKFRLVSQELFLLGFPLLKEADVTQRVFSNTAVAGAIVAHAYGEYSASEKFRVQTGLGWVPFGVALTERELPLLIRRNGPQIASGGLTMPFGLWTGVHVLGQFHTDPGVWGYNLYTATPTTDADRLGGGSRLWWSSPRNKITLGTSQQVLSAAGDTLFNIGGDLEIKSGRFGLKTEYARSFTNLSDIQTAYVEPYIQFFDGKWVVHADVDYADRPVIASDSVAFLPFERLQYGGGVNWLPWPFWRLRLLVLYNDHRGISATVGGRTNDYVTVDISSGIEF